ncbi:helix-turn-helix domain-containing protein [Nocardia sp. NPDC101769]
MPIDRGAGLAQIAETFGVSRKTVYRHLERDDQPGRTP